MKQLTTNDLKAINGGWLPLAFAALRLGFAIVRHSRHANAATWAARGAGIVGTTYQTAKVLDGYRQDR